MRTITHFLRCLAATAGLALAAGLANAALDTTAATDDHSINVPTGWWTYTNISPADLSSRLNTNGARLVDLEVMSVTDSGEPRFLARMVANSGAYAVPGWWWYYDQTPAQITTLLNANSGRLIELERYDRGGGQIRYALVMVPNTGNLARAWSYLLDVDASQLGSHMSSKTMRPIDLDTYGSGSKLRYSGVFVSNTGADAKPYQWASNQTLADISAKVTSFKGRVVKLDRQADGKYSFVQVKATGADATAWWHRYGFASLADLNNYAQQFAARPVDVLIYSVSGTRYYDATFIDNANGGTRRMRGEFAPFVDAATQTPKGIFAGYLKRLDSDVKIDLNGGRRAETASALKSLQLLHAMVQVQNGDDLLNENFDYYNYPPYNGDPKFPPEDHCPNPSYEIASNRVTGKLQLSMNQMMAISDNRIARGVVLRAGNSFAPLNSTAAASGLVGTTLRHNIGCAYLNVGTGKFSPSTLRNDTTAADLARIYEGVWKKQLLGTAHGARDAFLVAANPHSGAWDGLQAIISQEAAAMGKGSVALEFGSQIKRWGKGGSYGTCLGDATDMAKCGQAVVVYSSTGLVSLPAKNSGGAVVPRIYSFGVFVSDMPVSEWGGPDDVAFQTAYSHAKDELFRDEVRAALKYW